MDTWLQLKKTSTVKDWLDLTFEKVEFSQLYFLYSLEHIPLNLSNASNKLSYHSPVGCARTCGNNALTAVAVFSFISIVISGLDLALDGDIAKHPSHLTTSEALDVDTMFISGIIFIIVLLLKLCQYCCGCCDWSSLFRNNFGFLPIAKALRNHYRFHFFKFYVIVHVYLHWHK